MWWHTVTQGGGVGGNWRMEWVASTLHTTSEHGVSSITTSHVHTSVASSRLNWRPCRFKWTHPFLRKTKSGFCACSITFQTQSTLFCLHFLGCGSVYSDPYYIILVRAAPHKNPQMFWSYEPVSVQSILCRLLIELFSNLIFSSPCIIDINNTDNQLAATTTVY